MAKKAKKRIEGSKSMTKLDWITRPIRGSDWQNKTKAE